MNINGKGIGQNRDKTTTGATCQGDYQGWIEEGAMLLRKGDKTTVCPACKQIGVLNDGTTEVILDDGIEAILDGAIVTCGCPPGTNRVIAPLVPGASIPQSKLGYHQEKTVKPAQEKPLDKPCACNRDITLDELSSIAIYTDKELLATYLEPFNQGFQQYGITTCREKSHFLAQVCHESGGLKYTKEIGGEFKKYAPWYGRGLIQLTHEAKYKKYGEFVHEDFASDENAMNKIANPPHNVLSAFWFYCIYDHAKFYAKNDDFNMVTAVINGGFNGYTDRLNYFHRAIKVLHAEHLNKLEKSGKFLFFDSAISKNAYYSFGWGAYHDPNTHLIGTNKNKTNALEGYIQARKLYGDDSSRHHEKHDTKMYGLIEKSHVSHFIDNAIAKLKD